MLIRIECAQTQKLINHEKNNKKYQQVGEKLVSKRFTYMMEDGATDEGKQGKQTIHMHSYKMKNEGGSTTTT